jgi:hypothetical protein
VLRVIDGNFATRIVMRFGRRREFGADADSGEPTSKPQMVSALRALRRQHNEDGLPDEAAAFGIRSSKALGVRNSSRRPTARRTHRRPPWHGGPIGASQPCVRPTQGATSAAPTMPALFAIEATAISVSIEILSSHFCGDLLAPPPTMKRSGLNRAST